MVEYLINFRERGAGGGREETKQQGMQIVLRFSHSRVWFYSSITPVWGVPWPQPQRNSVFTGLSLGCKYGSWHTPLTIQSDRENEIVLHLYCVTLPAENVKGTMRLTRSKQRQSGCVKCLGAQSASDLSASSSWCSWSIRWRGYTTFRLW